MHTAAMSAEQQIIGSQNVRELQRQRHIKALRK